MLINNLKKELAAFKFENTEVEEEIRILFPEIKTISLGKHIVNHHKDSVRTMTVVLFDVKDEKVKIDVVKLQKWLEQKLGTKELRIIKE